MTDSNIFGRNPRNINASYGALEADLYQIRHDAELQKARENASLEAASLNQNLPFSVNGQVTSPEQMLQYLIADIERNPNSISVNYVRSQLIQNPLVRELDKQGMLPAKDIEDLAQKISQRTVAKANNRAVYNPEFGDVAPEDLVREANRPDAGFLERTWESTRDILGFTGRGETEAEIAEIDKQLSRYPTSFKLSFKKLQEIEKAKMELENLQKLLHSATDSASINQLHQRIAMQNERIATMQSHITEQDQANIQQYGQSFLQDWRKREGLKAREDLLTPRYSTTVQHERDIAEVNRKHLNMGHSASFSDPDSWTNGYVKDYMLTYADPDVLAKEVAPEVLPWVGLNFLIDAGAAALTGGASLPASVVKWAAMIGLGANSAYQAIDKNIDAYFEQHGTTAGFSELQSHIMEGIAFTLDMYGGRMLSAGIPGAVDSFIKGRFPQLLGNARQILENGRKAAEATGSAEPFKAAVKLAYQSVTLSKPLEEAGKYLAKSGKQANLTYGGTIGMGRQLAGAAITKGIAPLYSNTVNSALSLAAENMMSETARQVGRQNGMNADAIIESGLKGLVAGPIGRVGGVALGGARALGRMGRDLVEMRGNKYALLPIEMRHIKEGVEHALQDGSEATLSKQYNLNENTIEQLEKAKSAEHKSKILNDAKNNILEKYNEYLTIDIKGNDGELPSFEVVEKDNQAKAGTKEIKNKLKAYKKDLTEYEKLKQMAETADAEINKQLSVLKGYRTQLGEKLGIDSPAFYKMSDTAQKQLLRDKGLSEEEITSVLEDVQGKMEIPGLSKRALASVRDIFGTTAPGKLKEAIKNLPESERDEIVKELNKNKVDYKKLPTLINPKEGAKKPEEQEQYNQQVSGKEALKNLFSNAEEQKKKFTEAYRNYDKAIDPASITAEKAEAIAPEALEGLTDEQQNAALDIVQNNPNLTNIAEGKGRAAAEVVNTALGQIEKEKGVIADEAVKKAASNIAQAIRIHNTEYGAKTHGKGTKEVSKEETPEGMVHDEDTNTALDYKVATGTESKYENARDFANKSDKLSEIQTYIKAQKIDSDVVNYLKENKDFEKLVKQRNPGIKSNEISDVMNEFTSVDEITKVLVSSSVSVSMLRKALNNMHTLEAEKNKKAAEQAGKGEGKAYTRGRNKSGYKSATEHRDEAITLKERVAADKQAQEQFENVQESYRALGAGWLLSGEHSEEIIYKTICTIHDDVFGHFITKIKGLRDLNTLAGADLLKEFYQVCKNFDLFLPDKDGVIHVTSRTLEQLKVLINFCQNQAEHTDSSGYGPLAQNFAAMYNLLRAAIANNDINITEDKGDSTIGLWNQNPFVFKENLSTEEGRKVYTERYKNKPGLLNYTTQKINEYLTSKEIALEMFRPDYMNHLDFSRLRKASGMGLNSLLAFSQLIEGALQDKTLTALGANAVNLQEAYFGIVNHAALTSTRFWDALNSWGFADPVKELSDTSIRGQLEKATADPEVANFFKLDSKAVGQTRPVDVWKERWSTLTLSAQRKIALVILQNEFMLGAILGLETKDGKRLKEPRVFTENLQGDSFKKLSAKDLMDTLKDVKKLTLGEKDTTSLPLFAKIALAKRLAAMHVVDNVIVEKYTLKALTDPNGSGSLIKGITRMFKKEEDRTWANVAKLVRVFYNGSAKFRNLVKEAKEQPLGKGGTLPPGDVFDTITKEVADFYGDEALESMDILDKDRYNFELFANREVKAKDLQMIYGNLITAAGILSLCTAKTAQEQTREQAEAPAEEAAKQKTAQEGEQTQEAETAEKEEAKPKKAKKEKFIPKELKAGEILTSPDPISGKSLDLKFTEDTTLTQVDNLISYMSQVIAPFSEHNTENLDAANAESLPRLIRVIVNDPEARKDITSIEAEIESDIRFNNTSNDYTLGKFLAAMAEGHIPSYTDLFTESSMNAMARAFAIFINTHQIANVAAKGETGAELDLSFMQAQRKQDSLSDKAHKYSPLHSSNEETKIFIKSKNSVFLRDRAFDRVLAENPKLATNDFIKFVQRCTDALRYNLVQMKDDVIGSTEFDAEGNIWEHTVQVCSAVALSLMPRLSTDTSEEFKLALTTAYGAKVANTFANENNHLVDLSVTAMAMGTQVARILGYNPASVSFRPIAMRLGAIACLALEAGNMGIEEVWVNKVTGKILDSTSVGEDKANSIPALRITKQGLTNKDKIEISTEMDNNENLAEKLLGTEMFTNEKLYTSPDKLVDYESFAEEWEAYHNGESNGLRNAFITEEDADTSEIETNKEDNGEEAPPPKTEEVRVNYGTLKKAVGAENVKLIKNELPNKKGKYIGIQVKVGDYALIGYYKDADNELIQTFDELEDTQELEFGIMHHRGVTKTDFTDVAPFRLLSTVLNMKQGVQVSGLANLRMYQPLLKRDEDTNKWVMRWSYKEIVAMTPEHVNALCYTDQLIDKEHPEKGYRLTALGMLIYENSKYGSNPDKKSGVKALNCIISNKEDLKRIYKDCEAMLKAKAITDSETYKTFYFNELNTVNNRLFVDSLRYNYREFKHYRQSTNVHGLHNRTFNFENITDDQAALIAAPIMFNLGIKIDKMKTANEINNAWNNLLSNAKFKELLTAVKGIVQPESNVEDQQWYTKIANAIYDYNLEVEKSKLARYHAWDSKSQSESDLKAEFKVNIESVTTLAKLASVQLGSGDTLLSVLADSKINSYDTFKDCLQGAKTLKGYDISIEVDGLTNGPSIKNIISNMTSNQDGFSRLYLGATGISRDFTNIVSGYADYGVLDTYLFNGKLSKMDLIYQAALEVQNSNDTNYVRSFRYLNSLYGKEYTESVTTVLNDEEATLGYPPSFLNSFVSALNNILNRDFMKDPTMTIGYEAGKASIIATCLNQMDIQFSSMMSEGNADKMVAWVDNLRSIFGENAPDIELEFVDRDGLQVKTATLNIKTGNITCEAFHTKHVSELTSEQIKHISINHAANAYLNAYFSDVFGRMYDAIAHNKELIQAPLKAITDASQVLCEVFDTYLKAALENTAKHSDADGAYISSTEFAPALAKIANELRNKFNTIIRAGLETNEENKALIDLSKEDVDTIVGQAVEQYTVTSNGKHYIRTKSGLAARISKGAGVVPMMVHTYDSSIVHTMMAKVMGAINQRVLTIHDAAILGLSQIESGEGNANAVTEMNKAHYECQIAFIESLTDYAKNLTRAANALNIGKSEIFKISDSEKIRLHNSLKSVSKRIFSHAAQIVSLKEQFFNDELYNKGGEGQEARLSDGQYAFVGNATDGKAIGIYTPSDKDLEADIAKLKTIKDDLLKLIDLNDYKFELYKAVSSWATVEGQRQKKTIDLTNVMKDDSFVEEVAMQMSSIEEFAAAVVKLLPKDIIGTSKEAIADKVKSLTKAVETAVENSYKQSPEYKLRNTVLNTYQNIAKDKTSNYQSVVDTATPVTEVNNNIEDTTPEETVARNVYGLSQNAYTHGLLHLNSDAELHKARTEGLMSLRGLTKSNSLLKTFRSLRDMTGLNRLSSTDLTNFETIFNILSGLLNVNKFDLDAKLAEKGSDTTPVMFYADSNDYTAIARQAMLNKLVDSKASLNQRDLINWFGNMLRNLEQFEGKNVQLVFTLRSEGDLMYLLALQALKQSKFADKYAGVTAYILPGISNVTSESPEADKEVAMLDVLKSKNEHLRAFYATSTHHTHNVQLQSLVMGLPLTTSFAEEGIRTGKEKLLSVGQVTVESKKETVTYYSKYKTVDLDPNRFSLDSLEMGNVVRTDEFGRNIQDNDYDNSKVVLPTDLLTVPRNTEVKYAYSDKILDPNFRFDDGSVTIRSVDVHARSIEGESLSNFADIFGEDAHTTSIIECTASGRAMHPHVGKYIESEPMLKEAFYKKEAIRKARYERYLSKQTEEAWNEYLLPIVVSVSSDNFADKYYVFTTAIDNSITQADLALAIDDKGTGELTVAQMPRINENSALAGMVRERDKTNYNFLTSLAKYKEETGNKKSTFHVVIDDSHINVNLRYDTSPLAKNLMYRNAYVLAAIDKQLKGKGVTRYTLPVENIHAYEYHVMAKGLPGPKMPEQIAENIKMYHMDMADNVYESLIATMNYTRQIEKKAYASDLANSVRSYRGYKTNRPLRRPTTDYSDVSQRWVQLKTEQDFLASNYSNGTVLRFSEAAQTFNELLDTFIREDESRGVDTSLVEENRVFLKNLITLSSVNMFSDAAGVEASETYISSEGTPLERNEVFLGRAVGTQSGAEAFMHEILHTVWVHLGSNNPGLKKKLTDICNFVHKNLKYSDFKDGQTYTNESILDAIFNEKTPDTVEEFLCYYMTNRAFHDAVNKMAERKGATIATLLHSNTRGIFRKILSTIRQLFTGKQTEYKEIKTIAELVKQAAETSLIYNNKYWLNRQALLEKATGTEIKTLAEAERRWSYGTTTGKRFMNEAIKNSAIETAVNDNKFDKAVKGILSKINFEISTGPMARKIKKSWVEAKDGFLNDLMASLEGVSERQFDYLILRTRAKAQIDQKREQIKSVINEHVRNILKEVPEDQYERLTKHVIRTDVSCLYRHTDLNSKQIKELITDPYARAKEIKKLEFRLMGYEYKNYMLNAAKGLAQYLVTGFNPTGLGYRNAYEIMARSGSTMQTVVNNEDHYNDLNQLITLYALDLIPKEELSYIKGISDSVLSRLAEVHNGVKDADNDSIYPNALRASTHVPKGELHTTNNKHRYEIIPEAELRAYEWTGYRKVSDAVLDPFFKSQHPNTKFVMVRAPYKSDATTTAGIFSMTNIFKGRSGKGITIGNAFRTNQDEVTPFRLTQEYQQIQSYVDKRIRDLNSAKPHLLTTPTSGNLVLNFNCMNRLCGATFEVNPIESIKQRSTSQKVTSILGNLYGSILERSESPAVNRKIAESMIDIYEGSTEKEQFRWIKPNSENELYRELYETLPYEIREVMTEKYGDRGVPVHNKSLNTVFGYRNLSANDTKKFIEQERIKQNNADKLASAFSVNMGNILYNGYLGNIESLLKWLAHVGKDMIVVKGVTTSWYNIISNCVLLHMKGLSAKQVVDYQLEGLKQYDMLRRLNYQLAVLKKKRILNQYTDTDARDESIIRRSLEAIPIYALYKEGIIANTIAEDLTESENFTKQVIHAVTPQGNTRVVASNLALSNESMLYRILADFASLGDITGKYALYKFNRERFKDNKEALRESLEAFIDYSNPLPKQLQLADDLAVLPFMKYALGIQRVIGRILTQKPSRSLAWLFGANTLMNIPNTFESLLTIDSVTDRMQLPGEMFTDSFHALPSWKALTHFVGDE